MPSEVTRPIKIAIAALGGQGGGVLEDWLVAVAELHGWIVQATSIAGVAQRTGTTVYYLEMSPAPRTPAERPVLALMAVPGDVDLVVSDVVMPEMDGPTLAKELRTRNPNLKIIFVSGYAEDAFEKNLPDDHGKFHFLPKPFTLKQLVAAVKETMAA